MKQTESKTIAFLKEIGAKNVKSASQMKTELCRRYSREEAFEIHDRWVDVDRVSGIDPEDYDEIMSFFNASYERSIGAALVLDYDLYRDAFSIYEKGLDLFGKRILEYGCRNGIQSCFLGRLLPESEVLAIDDYEGGLKYAEKLRDSRGISNVTFRKDSLDSIPESEKYDTVVLTRTFQRKGISPGLPSSYMTLEEEAELLGGTYGDYLDAIVKHVADGGRLAFMDYAHFGSEMLALVQQLAKRGFRWLDERSERGALVHLYKHRVLYFAPQVLFFEKAPNPVDEQDLRTRFLSCMVSDESAKLPGYYLQEAAQAQLAEHAGEIVAGFSASFEYEDDEKDMVAGIAYRDKSEKDTYWRELQTQKEIIVYKQTIKNLDGIINDIWADAHHVAADEPDIFFRLRGSYSEIERLEVKDFSALPEVEEFTSVDKVVGESFGSNMSLLSNVMPAKPVGPVEMPQENDRSPGDSFDDLISRLSSKSSSKQEDRLRIILMDRGRGERKRKKHKVEHEDDGGPLGEVSSPVVESENADAAPAMSEFEKPQPADEHPHLALLGLKITYFSKSGRLNIEDQKSGLQWSVTQQGVMVDGEIVDASKDVQIGETGLKLRLTPSGILLKDENCGYAFTLKRT